MMLVFLNKKIKNNREKSRQCFSHKQLLTLLAMEFT